MRHRWAAIPAALLLLLTGGVTPAPTTVPTTAAALPVARWFDQLADDDPDVRSAAVDHLTALSAADGLPALLAAARAARPVRPAQAAVLYEVVTQVFLAAEPYDPNPGVFIMGQAWPRRSGDAAGRMGVAVVSRWPGFPARRLFRDGDLILGLHSDAGAPPGQSPDLPTRDAAELIAAMRGYPTPDRVALSVLRDGRVVRLVGPMVVEPAETHDRFAANTAAFLLDRQRRADDYWRSTFAPVVDPSPDGTAADSLDGPGR